MRRTCCAEGREGMLVSRCSDCPKVVAGALKECSQHPDCKGPTLIPNHAAECPDSNGGDCDNDHCWVPCMYCIDPDQMTKH